MAIRIFIDQGHNPGNINAGASANGLEEQQVTYQVGIYLADLLESDGRFEVRVSRSSPDDVVGNSTTTSLRERVYRANSWPADYFISIHANYSENPAINGSEVYIFRRFTQANWLADDVLNGIVETVHTRNNEVRVNPLLYVLRATSMPAILVELGYLTNTEDAEKLKNDQFQFAYGIYIGMLRYFGLEEPPKPEA